MDRLKDERFAKFYKTFLEKIAPKYLHMEEKRKVFIQKNKLCKRKSIVKSILLWLIFITMFCRTDLIAEPLFHIILLIFCIFCGFLGMLPDYFEYNKEYKLFLKAQVLPYMLQQFGNIVWETRSLDDTVINKFKNSGLFADFNYLNTDDIFIGSFKNIDFEVVETILHDSSDRNFCVFKGVILNYKINKINNTPTHVSLKKSAIARNATKTAICIFVFSFVLLSFVPVIISIDLKVGIGVLAMFILFMTPMVSVAFGFLKRASKDKKNLCEKIILEDSKFNKKFDVYSSNQVEARYLVSPLFMEKFYNLKTVFGAKNIRCSFFDNNLMIAIETNKDLFEIGSLFKPVKDIESIERFYDEITTIYDLIDYFKLNEKIYLT